MKMTQNCTLTSHSEKSFKNFPKSLSFMHHHSFYRNLVFLVIFCHFGSHHQLHILMHKTDTITEIWNLPMIPNFELKTPCTTFPQSRPLCHNCLQNPVILPFWLLFGSVPQTSRSNAQNWHHHRNLKFADDTKFWA